MLVLPPRLWILEGSECVLFILTSLALSKMSAFYNHFPELNLKHQCCVFKFPYILGLQFFSLGLDPIQTNIIYLLWQGNCHVLREDKCDFLLKDLLVEPSLHLLSSCSQHSYKAFLLSCNFSLWHISSRPLTLALGYPALLPTPCPCSSVYLLKNSLSSHLHTGTLPLSFPTTIHSYYSILISVPRAFNLFSSLFISSQTTVLSTDFFSSLLFLSSLAQREKNYFPLATMWIGGSRVLRAAHASNAV